MTLGKLKNNSYKKKKLNMNYNYSPGKEYDPGSLGLNLFPDAISAAFVQLQILIIIIITIYK